MLSIGRNHSLTSSPSIEGLQEKRRGLCTFSWLQLIRGSRWTARQGVEGRGRWYRGSWHYGDKLSLGIGAVLQIIWSSQLTLWLLTFLVAFINTDSRIFACAVDFSTASKAKSLLFDPLINREGTRNANPIPYITRYKKKGFQLPSMWCEIQSLEHQGDKPSGNHGLGHIYGSSSSGFILKV
jgi:hypothetical protein